MGRNWPPVTLMTVFESPCVTSRERNALIGVGQAGALASEPHWARTMGACAKRKTLEAAAASTRAGASTRVRVRGMKRGNDTRPDLVTQAARESTTLKLAPESATPDRGRGAAFV